MKTFTAFLFALLFCSNAVADNAGRTKGAYDWDKLRNDIIIYQNELLLPKKSLMNNTASGRKTIKKRFPHIFKQRMISVILSIKRPMYAIQDAAPCLL